MRLIPQDDNQMAVQVAVILAKAARSDYPKDWPTLLHDLLSNLPQGTSNTPSAAQVLLTRRVYLVLHHILKELSSKRLMADQKNFAAAGELLWPAIWAQWCNDASAVFNNESILSLTSDMSLSLTSDLTESQQQRVQLLVILERWLLLIKVLSRLVVFGNQSDFKSLQPVQQVSQCSPSLIQALEHLHKTLGSLRSSLPSLPSKDVAQRSSSLNHLTAMMERSMIKLLKTQRLVQEAHPWSFHGSGCLIPMLSFCCERICESGQEGGGGGTLLFGSQNKEWLMDGCMSFIRSVAICPAYDGKTSGGKNADPSDPLDQPLILMAGQVKSSLASFFTPPRLTSLIRSLVMDHLILRLRDLEDWSSNAEEYYHSKETGSSPTELLFLTLLNEHKEVLLPCLAQMIKEACEACPTNLDLSSLPGVRVGGLPLPLLRKEAAYAAAASGAYRLQGLEGSAAIDWEGWLKSSLLPELADLSPMNRVLRRRILHLISQWVPVLSPRDRPIVYQSILSSMAQDGDVCVQLAAVDCLRALIDDFGFEDSQFVDLVSPALQLVIRILTSSRELDTQTQAFNLMNLIIERMGDYVQPLSLSILGLMPQLWHESQGSSLVRIQILLAMQRLVHAMGLKANESHHVTLFPLSQALDPSNPESLSLMEDGLALLLVLLRNAPSPSDPSLAPNEAGAAADKLLSFTPLLAACMSSSSEHVKVVLGSLVSMTLLGSLPFVHRYSQQVNSILCSIIGEVNDKGTMLVFPALEIILGACYSSNQTPTGAQMLKPSLIKLLGLMLSGKENQIVMVNAWVVFSRILISSPQDFSDLIQSCQGQGQGQGQIDTDSLLRHMISTWCEGFDCLASSHGRKLCALGMCRLMTHPSPVIIEALEALLVCITGVWCELEGGEDNLFPSTYGQEYAWGGGGSGEGGMVVMSEEAEGETQRRQALSSVDPVAKMRVGAALRQGLEAVQATHGEQNIRARFALMDPEIAKAVQKAAFSS